MTFPNVVRDLLMFAPSWNHTHKDNNHISNQMEQNPRWFYSGCLSGPGCQQLHLQPGSFGSGGVGPLAARQVHQTDFTDLQQRKQPPRSQIRGTNSCRSSGSALQLATFSDVLSVSASCRFCVKMMLKTACERLLVSFMLVAATVLQRRRRRKIRVTFLKTGWYQDVNPSVRFSFYFQLLRFMGYFYLKMNKGK